MMTIHRSFTATQDKGDNRQRVLGMGEYIVRVADIISLRWVNDQVIDESSRTRVRMHLSAKQNTPHTHTHSKWHNNSSNMYTQRASENSVALYLRTLNGRAADTTTIACLCVCWAPAARVRMQPLPYPQRCRRIAFYRTQTDNSSSSNPSVCLGLCGVVDVLLVCRHDCFRVWRSTAARAYTSIDICVCSSSQGAYLFDVASCSTCTRASVIVALRVRRQFRLQMSFCLYARVCECTSVCCVARLHYLVI